MKPTILALAAALMFAPIPSQAAEGQDDGSTVDFVASVIPKLVSVSPLQEDSVREANLRYFSSREAHAKFEAEFGKLRQTPGIVIFDVLSTVSAHSYEKGEWKADFVGRLKRITDTEETVECMGYTAVLDAMPLEPGLMPVALRELEVRKAVAACPKD